MKIKFYILIIKIHIIILKIFGDALCVYALILFLAYLLRKRVCIDSRNLNNKYCILSHQWSKVYRQETTPGDRNSTHMFTLCWLYVCLGLL